jgi:hypothetical protein
MKTLTVATLEFFRTPDPEIPNPESRALLPLASSIAKGEAAKDDLEMDAWE